MTDNAADVQRNMTGYYQDQLWQSHAGLFNGAEFRDNDATLEEGHTYFLTNSPSNGTINYDGKVYENVPLLYNLQNDAVVTLYIDNRTRIRLLNEKITQFVLLNHIFLRIVDSANNNRTGYYELLYNGDIKVLCRYDKQQTAQRDIEDKQHYFLQINGQLYPADSRKEVLRIMNDQRKALQTFLKQRNFESWKKEKAQLLIEMAAYYEGLTEN